MKNFFQRIYIKPLGGLNMTMLAFIFGVVITLFALGVIIHYKYTQPKNNVHFYVARDNNSNELALWFGKPCRGVGYWVSVDNRVLLAAGDKELNLYNLKKEDYKDLKWEDEPIEVFLNLED